MQIEAYPLNQKSAKTLEWLKFDTVMFFVDARQDIVKVPQELKEQFDLRLNFDYEFDIPDFRVFEDRIEATLSFASGEFFCVIPFKAVYLILCHAIERGAVFPESVPHEMLEFFFNKNQGPLPKEVRRPFKIISENEELEKKSPKPKSKSKHLKLVK